MSDDNAANLIAQLQARLEALEQASASDTPAVDAVGLQRAIVEAHRRKQIAIQEQLTRDIRGQIARAYGYNPDGDFPSTNLKPYPTFVKLPDGKTAIAKNKYEHDQILGRQPEPAKVATVDISQLAAISEPAKRRGRPPKDKPAPLPANLE